MLPDLAKIVAADRAAQKAVQDALNEARAFKAQAEVRGQEIRARLQEELARIQEDAQEEILRQADARALDIQQASQEEVRRLTEQHQAHGEEAVAFLVSRVVGP